MFKIAGQADTQISLPGVGFVPKGDTGELFVRGNRRQQRTLSEHRQFPNLSL
jgi:hypothetical protein